MQTEPFFLKNESWWYFDPDDDERGYKLTDDAPPEAIDSYNEFYSRRMDFSDCEGIPEEERDCLNNLVWE